MKLRVCRLGRDDEDIAVLVRHLGLRGIEEADELLDRLYLGEERIPPNRRSVVEATFGEDVLSRAGPEVVLASVDRSGRAFTRGSRPPFVSDLVSMGRWCVVARCGGSGSG